MISNRFWSGQRVTPWLVAVLLCAGIAAPLAAPTQAHEVHAKARPAALEHGVVILIDSDDQRVMGHAIAYALNITRDYALKHETIHIEIVANGSGIALFRSDTSPLQAPLAVLRQEVPGIVFSMCEASKKIAEQEEGHTIDLIEGARLVPYGIGRVVELQESGWSYVSG